MSFNTVELGLVKVLVADQHILLAEGFAALVSQETNLEVVGIANDGNQCLTLIESKAPDIILLGISLLDCSGINLIDDIKSIHSTLKIIMLTGLNPQRYRINLLQKGVWGFLLKECNKKEMIEAIFNVFLGKEYYSKGLVPYMKPVLLNNDDRRQNLTLEHSDISEVLSGREEEIMNLIAKGLNNQEIASTLGITIRTVKFHTSNIFRKIGVKSRLQAVATWKL